MSHCFVCFEEKSEVIGLHIDWTLGFKECHIRHRCVKCGANWCEPKEDNKK